MALEILKITDYELKYYVHKRVPPEMGKSQIFKSGGDGWARTTDLSIMSAAL